MPLPGWRRGIPDPFHRRPLALLEFPENKIVLQGICPDRQIIAVRLEIEEDSGALIDAPRNSFEAHAELAVSEILNVFRHRIWEIGIGLNAVEEFDVSVAVQSTGLVRNTGRRLALFPLPAIDGEDLLRTFLLDPPNANHSRKGFRLGTNGFVREIDLDRLLCDRGHGYQKNRGHGQGDMQE